MKKKGLIPAVLLTVVITFTGYFMPSIVCGIQDSRNYAEVEGFPSVDVSLSFSHDMSLPEKLEIFSSGISYTVNTASTDGDGYDKVVSELKRLMESFASYGYDIFYGGDMELVQLSPYIAVFNDEHETTMRIWICELHQYDGIGNVTIYLDDETGCVLGMGYYSEKEYPEWLGGSGAYIVAECYAMLYNEALEEYNTVIEPIYSIDDSSKKEFDTESSISTDYSDYSSVARMTFQKDGENYEIITASRYDLFIFNAG